jgi:hypothetical protein
MSVMRCYNTGDDFELSTFTSAVSIKRLVYELMFEGVDLGNFGYANKENLPRSLQTFEILQPDSPLLSPHAVLK